jgi:hypothetical protein
LDTYNLLAAGILQLARAIARQGDCPAEQWLDQQELSAYTKPSIKGTAEIDWSDPEGKEQFLGRIVTDARRVLAMANREDPAIKEAAQLLDQILLQDVVEITPPDNPSGTKTPRATLVQGTAPGRVPSVSDPLQRHGRKSGRTHPRCRVQEPATPVHGAQSLNRGGHCKQSDPRR